MYAAYILYIIIYLKVCLLKRWVADKTERLAGENRVAVLRWIGELDGKNLTRNFMARLSEDDVTVVLNIKLPVTLKNQFAAAVKKTPDADASKVLRAFMRKYVAASKKNIKNGDLFELGD